MKKEIKRMARKRTDEVFPENDSLFDTHRLIPKRKNGTYTDENTVIKMPIDHQIEHGTFKQRESEFEKLKSLFDDRQSLMKSRMKIDNALLAYKRGTDVPTIEMIKFYEEKIKEFVKFENKRKGEIEKQLEKINHPVANAMREVDQVGPVIAAGCIIYLDIKKARHPSSFWKYCGLDKPFFSRYEKGKSSGGNKKLRTVLYNMAKCQEMCLTAPYRPVYDNKKQKLAQSEKICEQTRGTDGKIKKNVKWKDVKPCHRRGAALREVMKHFLADLHYVWCCIEGIEPSKPYAEAQLGKHKTIMPEERGWIF